MSAPRSTLARWFGALSCLGLLAGQDAFAEQVQRTLQRAREPLLAQLALAHTTGEPGTLGLLCLAALHDGVPVDDAVLARGLERLVKARIEATYALAVRLMVAEACATLPQRERIGAADSKQLLRHRDGGAFTYTETKGEWDLSNSQYAALGLRAAASLGVNIARKVWLELADSVMDAQTAAGAFTYRQKQGDATLSMTAAGICVLAICRQALALPGRHMPELDRRIERAWQWLAEHRAAIGKLEQPWCHYAHYGLERAAILCDVADIGGVDWYREGAQMLMAAQRRDGGWATADTPVVNGVAVVSSADSAFAVLFLRRSFQKVAAPLTGPRTVVLAGLTATSAVRDVDACVEGLVRRGKAAVSDVLAALRGEVLPARRAAAVALRRIAGEDFGIDPELDGVANAAALRRAELWYLRQR